MLTATFNSAPVIGGRWLILLAVTFQDVLPIFHVPSLAVLPCICHLFSPAEVL